MKKIWIAFLFLLVNIEMVFAKTGTIKGDNIVIWGPVLLIAIILVGYKVRARIKERKEQAEQEAAEAAASKNSSAEDSSVGAE